MTLWKRCALFAAVGLVSAAWLFMAEVDSLLGTIQGTGGQSFGISALKGLPGDPAIADLAVKLWSRGTEGDYNALSYVEWYVGLNPIFVAAVVIAAVWMLRWLYPSRRWWIAPIIAGLFALAEDITILVAVNITSHDTGPLYFFTIGKWLSILFSALVIGTGLVVRLVARDRRLPILAVLWQFRIQVAAVAILAFAVAWPTRDRYSFMQQLPDITRAYADILFGGSPGRWIPRIAVALGTVALMVAVIWITGHWLRFRPATPSVEPKGSDQLEPDTAPQPWRRELLWLATLVGLLALLVVSRWPLPLIAIGLCCSWWWSSPICSWVSAGHVDLRRGGRRCTPSRSTCSRPRWSRSRA